MYIPKQCAASKAVTRFFDFLFPRSPRSQFKVAVGFEISTSQPFWNDRPRGLHIRTGSPYGGGYFRYGPGRLHVRDEYGGYDPRNDYRRPFDGPYGPGRDPDPYYDNPY